MLNNLAMVTHLMGQNQIQMCMILEIIVFFNFLTFHFEIISNFQK